MQFQNSKQYLRFSHFQIIFIFSNDRHRAFNLPGQIFKITKNVAVTKTMFLNLMKALQKQIRKTCKPMLNGSRVSHPLPTLSTSMKVDLMSFSMQKLVLTCRTLYTFQSLVAKQFLFDLYNDGNNSAGRRLSQYL